MYQYHTNNLSLPVEDLPEVLSDDVLRDFYLHQSQSSCQIQPLLRALPVTEIDWPDELMAEDFISRLSQQKDYNLALLAQDSYLAFSLGLPNINRLNDEQLALLGINQTALYDTNTGFSAAIYRYTDMYILSFTGSNELKDLYANIRQGLGLYEPQYYQAIGLVNILTKIASHKLICIGHSLGGGLASVAGLAANAPTITFSPAGVSRRMITAIGLKSEDIIRRVNVGKLRFYTVKHDWLDYFQQTLAIPKSVGLRISLPYSQSESLLDRLRPSKRIVRCLLAHTIHKIIEVMSWYQPWQSIPGLKYAYQSSEKDVTPVQSFIPEEIINANEPSMKLYATSLHQAASCGNRADIQRLLSAGARINDIDIYGKTALHYALNSHALNVAADLLAHGANGLIRDAQQMTGHDILSQHIIGSKLLNTESQLLRVKSLQLMS